MRDENKKIIKFCEPFWCFWQNVESFPSYAIFCFETRAYGQKNPERSILTASVDKETFACLGNLTFSKILLDYNLKGFNFLE